MHALDPKHAVPSGSFGFEQTPVAELHMPTMWQPSLAAHVTLMVPAHVPLTQEYVSHKFGVATVQVPPVSGVSAEHVPVPCWQIPAVLHASLGHVTASLPVHTPAWQMYICSHLFEPEHWVPVNAIWGGHAPLAGRQPPAVWHESLAGGHWTGFDPVQTPPWQVYVCSHLLPCVAREQGAAHWPQLPSSVFRLTHAVPQRFGRVALGQVAWQVLVAVHVSVPFAGAAVAHVAHVPPLPLTLPQRIVPGPQVVQMPAVQLVPIAQTLPQPPQLFLSVWVSTSQPFAALLSQLAIGALHMGSLHLPPTHPSTPPVMLHGCPQAPQFPTFVLVSISQPFAGFLSQSAYPVAQAATVHLEPTQVSVPWFALHALPHAPQFPGSFVVFTHFALAPGLHSVGPFGVGPLGVAAQAWPHPGGAPLQLALPPPPGVGHMPHVVPQELVDSELSGTQVPLQLW
jgi:hypothetical protein